jgi:hypothetical protein
MSSLFDHIVGNIDSFSIPERQKFSVLIDDVSEEDLNSLGYALGHERLSITTSECPIMLTELSLVSLFECFSPFLFARSDRRMGQS